MLSRESRQLFAETRAMAELGALSVTDAAAYSKRIHANLVALDLDAQSQDRPGRVLIAETRGTVILNTAGSHTASDPVRVKFPTNGTVLGIGVTVAEGREYRSRIDMKIERAGTSDFFIATTPGVFGSLEALCGVDDGPTNYLQTNIAVSSSDEWLFYFTSLSALVAVETELTLKPWFHWKAA